MNWRWLLLDYTDPALPLTRQDRRAVWWKAQELSRGLKHSASGPHAPRIVRLVHPLMPAAGLLLGQITFSVMLRGVWFAGALGIAIGATLSWVAMTYLGKWIWRPHVNQALREMGYDVCGWCGYWLRGLDDSTQKCPECGRARVTIDPAVRSQTPR